MSDDVVRLSVNTLEKARNVVGPLAEEAFTSEGGGSRLAKKEASAKFLSIVDTTSKAHTGSGGHVPKHEQALKRATTFSVGRDVAARQGSAARRDTA